MNSQLSNRTKFEIDENTNPNYKQNILNMVNSPRKKERDL